MFCENCGNKLTEGAKFCESCGSKVNIEPASQSGFESSQNNNNPPMPTPQPEPPAYSQPQPAQPVYNQPPQKQNIDMGTQINSNFQNLNMAPLKVGQFLGMILLSWIPLLNIVLFFIWVLKGSVNKNKKNYAWAMLIIYAAITILYIVTGASLVSYIRNMF